MYRVKAKTCQKEEVSVKDYCKPRQNPTDNQQKVFLAEVGNHCPFCGCYLLKHTCASISKLYEIAHIFPNSPTPIEEKLLNSLKQLKWLVEHQWHLLY